MADEQIRGDNPQHKSEDEHQSDKFEVKINSQSDNDQPISKISALARQMFLIEIIVEEFRLSYCTEFLHRCYRGPNCLSFEFLDQKPLIICLNMPVLKDSCQTKMGASLLFALNAEELERARKEFLIDIKAYRSIPEEEVLLGTGKLDVTSIMKMICAKHDAEEFRKEIEKNTMKRRPLVIPEMSVDDLFTEILPDKIVLQAPLNSVCDSAASVALKVRLTFFGRMVQANCQLSTNTTVLPYIECNRQ